VVVWHVHLFRDNVRKTYHSKQGQRKHDSHTEASIFARQLYMRLHVAMLVGLNVVITCSETARKRQEPSLAMGFLQSPKGAKYSSIASPIRLIILRNRKQSKRSTGGRDNCGARYDLNETRCYVWHVV